MKKGISISNCTAASCSGALPSSSPFSRNKASRCQRPSSIPNTDVRRMGSRYTLGSTSAKSRVSIQAVAPSSLAVIEASIPTRPGTFLKGSVVASVTVAAKSQRCNGWSSASTVSARRSTRPAGLSVSRISFALSGSSSLPRSAAISGDTSKLSVSIFQPRPRRCRCIRGSRNVWSSAVNDASSIQMFAWSNGLSTTLSTRS